MPLIALASVKSSPGVTTAALALASTWKSAERRLLVEADPSGGDLGLWLGLPAAAGLAGLAAAARHGHQADLPWRHALELAGGTHLIAAPAGADQAAACVAALTAVSLPEELAAGAEPVLADCGRLYPGSAGPAGSRRRGAHAAGDPAPGQRASASGTADPRARGSRAAAGPHPDRRRRRPPGEPSYPAREIAAALGVPVRATLPDDPRAAGQLYRRAGDPGPARQLPRLSLLRQAAAVARALDAAPGCPPAAPGLPAEPQDCDETEVSVGDRG